MINPTRLIFDGEKPAGCTMMQTCDEILARIIETERTTEVTQAKLELQALKAEVRRILDNEIAAARARMRGFKTLPKEK